jgi:hypothetical protein
MEAGAHLLLDHVYQLILGAGMADFHLYHRGESIGDNFEARADPKGRS